MWCRGLGSSQKLDTHDDQIQLFESITRMQDTDVIICRNYLKIMLNGDSLFAVALLLAQILLTIFFINDSFNSAHITILSDGGRCQLFLAPSKGKPRLLKFIIAFCASADRRCDAGCSVWSGSVRRRAAAVRAGLRGGCEHADAQLRHTGVPKCELCICSSCRRTRGCRAWDGGPVEPHERSE